LLIQQQLLAKQVLLCIANITVVKTVVDDPKE
jgi:hypothetical protein